MAATYTVNAAQYLTQLRAAEEWGRKTLDAARAAGRTVVGDEIIVHNAEDMEQLIADFFKKDTTHGS